jgi:hypothetical protein
VANTGTMQMKVAGEMLSYLTLQREAHTHLVTATLYRVVMHTGLRCFLLRKEKLFNLL